MARERQGQIFASDAVAIVGDLEKGGAACFKFDLD